MMKAGSSLSKRTAGNYSASKKVMDKISESSMKRYQALIEQDSFWKWYTEITPIEHISRIPIASRPVSRANGDKVDFKNLRAIPWVFAWTQIRYNITGWYGVGTGLQEVIRGNLRELRDLYMNWPFFKTIIDNAQQEMARARPVISEFYHQLSRINLSPLIMEEIDHAREAILSITNQKELLDNRPVIQKSIFLRNPYTDVLNLIQVELLREWRESDKKKTEQLRHAIFLSINGIAAAMQSTG